MALAEGVCFNPGVTFVFPEGWDIDGSGNVNNFLLKKGCKTTGFLGSKKADDSIRYCVLGAQSYREYTTHSGDGRTGGGKGWKAVSSRRSQITGAVSAAAREETLPLGRRAEGQGYMVISLQYLAEKVAEESRMEKGAAGQGKLQLSSPGYGFTDWTSKPCIVIDDMLGFYPRIERVG